MLYKKGGFRDVINVGIEYLESVLSDMEKEGAIQSPEIKERAEKKLQGLKDLRDRNSLALKKLGVLEDKERVSMVFSVEQEGDFFLFDKFCFVKVENKGDIPKVAKILGKRNYIEFTNFPTVKEVK